ncbi:hypothetical protein XU18_3089, partial [Perkinsela sp. CCAP 1560/4]
GFLEQELPLQRRWSPLLGAPPGPSSGKKRLMLDRRALMRNKNKIGRMARSILPIFLRRCKECFSAGTPSVERFPWSTCQNAFTLSVSREISWGEHFVSHRFRQPWWYSISSKIPLMERRPHTTSGVSPHSALCG